MSYSQRSNDSSDTILVQLNSLPCDSLAQSWIVVSGNVAECQLHGSLELSWSSVETLMNKNFGAQGEFDVLRWTTTSNLDHSLGLRVTAHTDFERILFEAATGDTGLEKSSVYGGPSNSLCVLQSW